LLLRAARLVRRVLSPDEKVRAIARYRLGMAIRGIDMRRISVAELGLAEDQAIEHGASGGPELDEVLAQLPITAADSVIDLGCGMGAAMITLARYPFARVDGLELAPQLIPIARRNLARMWITNYRIDQGDAAEFTGYDQYSYVYMFNPFPRPVMERVLENIAESAQRAPRELRVIYKNPQAEDLVLAAGFALELRSDYAEQPCCVYRRLGPVM
jgi:SAM-dependent methyltransferase